MTERAFDVVVFGATGFTGGLVAQYLAGCEELGRLRWALAGRSRDKLRALAAGLDLPPEHAPELLVADVGDEGSLRAMAERTRVLLTTVGPYCRYGEPVVRACAELGTDYVDLTGEPAFVRHMVERYDETARGRGARIVHACGFDSIPHDLGAYFTLLRLRDRLSPEQREREAVTIEGVVRAFGQFSGGTWHSALEIMSQVPAELGPRRAWEQALAQGPRKVRIVRGAPRHRADFGLWTVPLPTIDPEVVARSAAALPEYGPDFRYGHYAGVDNALQMAGMIAGAGTLFALAQAEPLRKLLRKVRDPGEGPSPAQRDRGWFRVTFLGRAADQEVHCEVRGGDPGYGETAKMLAESALCLALDRHRLPEGAGVITTAQAMGEVLIDRLHAAGITFIEDPG
ncbi:MAG: saccharopine dehydrogenase NADP-binding domain-containing protein [Myxococcales bacterium]|jgi:short subunit dehydrogenase-like uncharacterized protein